MLRKLETVRKEKVKQKSAKAGKNDKGNSQPSATDEEMEGADGEALDNGEELTQKEAALGKLPDKGDNERKRALEDKQKIIGQKWKTSCWKGKMNQKRWDWMSFVKMKKVIRHQLERKLLSTHMRRGRRQNKRMKKWNNCQNLQVLVVPSKQEVTQLRLLVYPHSRIWPVRATSLFLLIRQAD